MTGVRRPNVAGSFYPAERVALQRAVAGYLTGARVRPRPAVPKALIVPHAGYVYSGPVAASAYAQLEVVARRTQRVVLVGPSHYMPFRGLAASGADAFRTPLGEVRVDRGGLESALALPQVRIFEAAFEGEHSLEVQLPFLQCALGDFGLVPLLAGEASDTEVAELLEALWGGPETLIVISSDLSHYHDYAAARTIDAATARAIVALDAERLDRESACGRVGVRGLLVAARRRGLAASALDLRSSGDTAGPMDQVVGYGAFALTQELQASEADPSDAPG